MWDFGWAPLYATLPLSLSPSFSLSLSLSLCVCVCVHLSLLSELCGCRGCLLGMLAVLPIVQDHGIALGPHRAECCVEIWLTFGTVIPELSMTAE